MHWLIGWLLGWLISILVGYIAQIAAFIKGRGSDQWPRENASVYASNTSDLSPGGIAEIVYSYSHKGQYFAGRHKRRFRSYFEANSYVGRFRKESQIVIRVKPERPKTSILRDDDQNPVAPNAPEPESSITWLR